MSEQNTEEMTVSSKDGSSAWPLSLRFPTPRRSRTLQFLVFAALVLNIILSCVNLADHSLERYVNQWREEKLELPFGVVPLNGYLNSGNLNRFECRDLAHNSGLEIQQSFHLYDDIFEIAKSLADHPMVDYEGQEEEASEAELIRKTWARFAQSSVWLEDQKIYLAVTRVIFYPSRRKDVPSISFIRGQIYDQNWEELRNHTVNWHGESITFPRVLDIPAPYRPGDVWFGPEDPRIIIEEGVLGAEPVIIFNMISDLTAKAREMHAYRPFSGAFTILRIEDNFERTGLEKNWAPFFYRPSNHTHNASRQREPDHHLYFLYALRPFTVLRCNLLSGLCKTAYKEDLSESGRHNDHAGRISGGTQFVPLHVDSVGTVSFIGFPRTHINSGCGGVMYRPELMVMTGRDQAFHVDYVSSPIDFDHLGMDLSARADPCGEGRILIANSVARWERPKDTLTLTFSVDDMSTQAIRIRGVGRHVESLQSKGLLDPDNQGDGLSWSTIGQDVIGCSVFSAEGYAEDVAISASFKSPDFLQAHVDREKKFEELEEKIGRWEKFIEEKAEEESERNMNGDKLGKGKDDEETVPQEEIDHEEKLKMLNDRIEHLKETVEDKIGQEQIRQQQPMIKEDGEDDEWQRKKAQWEDERNANEKANVAAERLRNANNEEEEDDRQRVEDEREEIEAKKENAEVEGTAPENNVLKEETLDNKTA